MANQSSTARANTNDGRLSEPMALVVTGAVVALLAFLVASVADGDAFGAFAAAAIASIGSTLWLVGVIAMGIRVGRK